jgi:hypothetical protein
LNLGATLARTLAHFFPRYQIWMWDLTDTRDQEAITYGRKFLLWQGLMLFLCKLGSRRQLRFALDSPEALANLNRLSGERQKTRAHSDTVEHFLGHVPPDALENFRHKMVYRLLRMKFLDHARVGGCLPVVIDGTGLLNFGSHRHCEHCLTRTVNDHTAYYHHVLEAKLVTQEGLAFSLESEFIENMDEAASKQDCELKAFVRLAQRLHDRYPQLHLCLLFDALYANGTAMQICEAYGWKYLTTFKSGSLPSLWREYEALRDQCPQNTRVIPAAGKNPRQTFRWVNGLEHTDDQGRRHRVDALECRERDKDGKDHYFAWLTNFQVDATNVADLANRGGRCRWKIENEGFNNQKNGGFNLEHVYSTTHYKNWYLLLQIAHMILQLVERGSLLSAPCQKLFGSIRNLAVRLLESFRNHLIPPEALDPQAAAAIQIRLNSS